MLWIVAAAVALVVLVVAVLALRRKPPAAPPLAQVEPAVALPAQPVAPVATTFERVSCMLHGAVHGAMPPFGKLTMGNDVLHFEANSRVVTKTGALADDGSATMQSLGSVELGQFQFDWPVTSITGTEFRSQTVTIHCGGESYQVEGLGARGAALKAWLTAQGVFRD